jgi:hypothetical protein
MAHIKNLSNRAYISGSLKDKLSRFEMYRYSFIYAPTGYGKSKVIRTFFKNYPGYTVLWIDAESSREIFWDNFCNAVKMFDNTLAAAFKKIGFPDSDYTINEVINLLSIMNSEKFSALLVIDNFDNIFDDNMCRIFAASYLSTAVGLRYAFILKKLTNQSIINLITKKKNNKYDMENRNIKRYSDLIKEEDNVEAPIALAKVVETKKEMPKLIVKEEKKKTPEIIEKLDEEEIESLEIEEPKEEVIVTKPSSIEEISKLIENTLEQEPIDLTNFEEEQEKDAIISYDELVKRAGAKKIIYRAETKAEEKKEPVKVIKTEKKQEPFVNKKGEYAGTFKASQIVSPIYGVKKNDDINENFIDLEEFKLDETKSEEERENEFLGNLKTFRNNLD